MTVSIEDHDIALMKPENVPVEEEKSVEEKQVTLSVDATDVMTRIFG